MQKELKFLIYNTPESDVSIQAVVKGDTIWLTQKGMAELFDVEVPAISKHLSNIFAEGELQVEATVSKMEIVQKEGSRQVKRSVDFYNLDAIISVGYRVNSRKATNFRIWATGVLKEYMTKGFAMAEFATSINEFLAFRRYDILTDKGSVSKREADAKAKAEYDEFNKTQKIVSDFEKEMRKIARGGKKDE